MKRGNNSPKTESQKDFMATMSSEASDVQGKRLTREQRVQSCGVDCPDSIVWRHWGVGGEYLRKLIIKNTHDKLQVIQYKLPRQKATFFVEFPEPVTLSSGMAYELVVRFRPTEMVEHHDAMEIEVKGRGSFLIDLVALTPYAKLDTPEKYDFRFCPVNALSTAQLHIKNGGTVPLDFEWEVREPFCITPSRAQLAEGDGMPITVTFRPQEASAMVAQAVCKTVAGEVLSVVRLSGIGKYTFVHAGDNSLIDFGGVLTSTVVTRVITVQNRSCVNAAFDIVRTDRDIVNPFRFQPTKGTIAPDSKQELTVTYTPESTSAHYTNDFVMTTVGGNKIDFRCTGTAIGPKVSLAVRVLDFGDVDLDAPSKHEKIIAMKNESAMEAQFQFVGCDPGGAFVITPFTGTLGPKKIQNIAIRFDPNSPINYFKRVHVVVKHSDEALFIDLLGTAYNSKARPAPFTHKYVKYYLNRIASGLGRTTPDDIEKLMKGIKEGTPPADEDEAAARNALMAAMDDAVDGKLARTEPLANVLPSDERLQLPFSLEQTRVVFRHGATIGAQQILVRNNTSSKATAVWSVPTSTPWNISPATQDVPAFSTATFEVKLAPDTPPTSFGHYVECFCFYKTMRSFRLVNERTFTPSQCLLLLCQCIRELTETSATPQVAVPTHVAFPACHVQSSVFQVLPLSNEGDTVAAFDIHIETHATSRKKRGSNFREDAAGDTEVDLAEDTSQVFTCFPASGTITPNGTALVLFKFAPQKTVRYRGSAQVSFNESTIGVRAIPLRGEGFLPEVVVSNNGLLQFRPTAVGGVTTREYELENPSRIPVKFSIAVPGGQSDKIVVIEPCQGVLRGCERRAVKATFRPTAVKQYEIKIPITAEAEHAPADVEPVVHRQVFHAVGEGLVGVVAVEPLEVQFGTVLVGADAHKTITVFNSSLCDVEFQMRYNVKSSRCNESAAPPLQFLPSSSGILKARSHVNVEVTVKLPHRGAFAYTVYVISGGTASAVDATQATQNDIERLPHCDVMVSGGHPTLEITDVRSVYQRKSHLWRQMSVTQINHELKEPVLPRDIETSSFTFEAATKGLDSILCDLGVDVLRTAPIRVLLRLDNVGHCPVKFRFWFPHESEVPKEAWYQEAATGAEYQATAEVVDRHLFDVCPRSGAIPAKGHIVVLLSYQHIATGQHTLPLLLRIDQGKRLLIHLTARTLTETTKFLAFHHTMAHDLLPVAVGDLDPPLQYTELQNLSHQEAEYVVRTDTLQELREKNYDFPIFQCLNPRGTIPPMSTLLLSWYFRPLEPKRYEVRVRIHVEGGETYVLALGATGYHPKKVTPQEVRQMHEKDAFPLPIFPTLRHPLLPLRLSMDVLRFNAVPFHSLHRQLIALQNFHPTDTFLYSWHSVLQYGDQLLDVDPPRGRIHAGESVHFRVTMYSGSTSQIIDNPIHCYVLNEDLRNRRLARRDALEKEQAMQLEQQPGQAQAPMADQVSTLSSTAAANEARKDARLVSKTRPPITTVPAKYQNATRLRQAIQHLTEAAVAEEVHDDDPEQTFADVLPTVLEVLVQARIMPIAQYDEIYPGSKPCYYPTLDVYSNPAPADIPSLLPITNEEAALVRSILDDFAKQVVLQPRVQEAYTDPTDDPVPYFCQMTSSEDGKDAAAPVDDEANGELKCLIEEVIESAIYNIMSEAQNEAGVFTRASTDATRVQKLNNTTKKRVMIAPPEEATGRSAAAKKSPS